MEAIEKEGVKDAVRGHSHIKNDEQKQMRMCCYRNVFGEFNTSSFCAVVRTKTGLKLFTKF